MLDWYARYAFQAVCNFKIVWEVLDKHFYTPVSLAGHGLDVTRLDVRLSP